MNSLKRIATAVCLVATIAVLVPAVRADDAHWPTILTFTEPVQIGERIFPPGSYLIKRSPSIVTSRVAMIYSFDRARWEGIIIGFAARRPAEKRESIAVTFEKQAQGKPEALRYWFYQDRIDGIEFPYSGINATQNASNDSAKTTTIARSAR